MGYAILSWPPLRVGAAHPPTMAYAETLVVRTTRQSRHGFRCGGGFTGPSPSWAMNPARS